MPPSSIVSYADSPMKVEKFSQEVGTCGIGVKFDTFALLVPLQVYVKGYSSYASISLCIYCSSGLFRDFSGMVLLDRRRL